MIFGWSKKLCILSYRMNWTSRLSCIIFFLSITFKATIIPVYIYLYLIAFTWPNGPHQTYPTPAFLSPWSFIYSGRPSSTTLNVQVILFGSVERMGVLSKIYNCAVIKHLLMLSIWDGCLHALLNSWPWSMQPIFIDPSNFPYAYRLFSPSWYFYRPAHYFLDGRVTLFSHSMATDRHYYVG